MRLPPYKADQTPFSRTVGDGATRADGDVGLTCRPEACATPYCNKASDEWKMRTVRDSPFAPRHSRLATHASPWRIVIGWAVLAVPFWTLFGCSFRASAPAQPMAFNHKVHAGDYQIPCLYCHTYARWSPVAGVPSMERCMGCHASIESDHPEIGKLRAYWARKEPISWVRVHTLPAFVRFSHKRHVRADITCQTCHGPVERMIRVRQTASLEMGWCVECHRQRKASTDCLVCHY